MVAHQWRLTESQLNQEWSGSSQEWSGRRGRIFLVAAATPHLIPL